MIQYISLKREGDKIYLLLNLIEVGYLTVEDFAKFRGFGDGFWAGDFTELILPRLNPPDPKCSNCDARGDMVKDQNIAYGAPLCPECYAKLAVERVAQVERELSSEGGER